MFVIQNQKIRLSLEIGNKFQIFSNISYMNFNIQYENPKESLLTRLFKVRGIQDNVENFLNPKLADYWLDPFLLNDMEIAVERIKKALKDGEKIMIF